MEAYQLTAEMSILITQKIIENKQLKSGYHTPAELFGSKLVLELAGSNFF